MEYPKETNEEFSARMDRLRKESEERIAKMPPEQQAALRATQRRFARKCQDQADTDFVLRIREQLETSPVSISPEIYQAYLRILEREKEQERRKTE